MVRPRVQRAFLRWLEGNKRLQVGLRLAHRTDSVLELASDRGSPHIKVHLYRDGVAVAAEWEEEPWDLLYCEDVAPLKTPEGYVCALCPEEDRTVFADRLTLWEQHLFEPLLEWLNGELAPAQALHLYRTDGGGSTWASLYPQGRDSQESASMVASIPLSFAAATGGGRGCAQ